MAKQINSEQMKRSTKILRKLFELPFEFKFTVADKFMKIVNSQF